MSNLRKKINIDSNGNDFLVGDNPGYFRIADGKNPNLDAFGRLRISSPVSLFDTQNQYNDSPLFWETVVVGGGTATHLPNESSVRLRCTTASGDKVIRQTRCYHRYQPGKSQLIEMTGVMGAIKTNVRQRLGYFDNNNGLFFQQDGTNLSVVRRTYASGATVDNEYTQANWNMDTLDGNGPSGITLDTSKAHIFVIDMQWLGVGRIRFGVVVDGMTYYCHEVVNANVLTEVYMTTANLPLRYEIENTGTTASETDLKQICATVQSEGGFDDAYGITHSASNGVTPISVTTRRPILTVRPKTTFNSITNRGTVAPLTYDIFAQTNSAYYEIVYNGTLTGASYTSISDNSITEYDVAATAITGGDVIDSGFCTTDKNSRNSITNVIKSKIRLCNDYAGTTTDTLSIVVTSFTGTATVSGALTIKEFY